LILYHIAMRLQRRCDPIGMHSILGCSASGLWFTSCIFLFIGFLVLWPSCSRAFNPIDLFRRLPQDMDRIENLTVLGGFLIKLCSPHLFPNEEHVIVIERIAKMMKLSLEMTRTRYVRSRSSAHADSISKMAFNLHNCSFYDDRNLCHRPTSIFVSTRRQMDQLDI
jgi:hypothetical protein